jgi:hypothetical protein
MSAFTSAGLASGEVGATESRAVSAAAVSPSGEDAIDAGGAAPRRRWREPVLVAAYAVAATLLVFREVWLSGFSRIPGDAYDGRLNAFFVEHSWGWLVRRPLDRSLWGLPIFFPHGGNALAYSDAMVSFGPAYWPWRALGLRDDVAYALWCMSVVALSIAAAYAMLRLALRSSPVAAAVGAWLVACSASRLHQVSRSQLLPMVYVVAGLGGAVLWGRLEDPSRRRLALVTAAAALVAQLYGGFYQGLFLGLCVVVLGALAMASRGARPTILRHARADAGTLIATAVLTVLALLPWLRHYRAAQSVVGARAWAEIEPMVPRPATWLYMSPDALLYGWTDDLPIFHGLPWDFEHVMGLGLLTTACLVAAAWAGRHRLDVRLAAGLALVLVLATTSVGGHGLWRHLVELIPPLGAARAISRIGLMLPLVAAVVLGAWLDAARGRGRAVVLALLVACCLEQVATLDTHERDAQRIWVADVARRVDRRAAAFVVSRSSAKGGANLVHLDAMFAANLTGVPTVNGASGSNPPGWEGLQWVRVRNELAARAFGETLDAWVRSGGVDPGRVQWIQLPPSYRNGNPGARPARRGARPAAPPAAP